MKIVTDRELLQVERKKNAALQNALLKAQSDIDYLSLMTGVELSTEDTNEVTSDE